MWPLGSMMPNVRGLGLSISVMKPIVFVSVRGYEYVLEPSPIPLPLDRPQETRVLQVSCGRAHSLVLTDNEGGELTRSRLMEEQGSCFLAVRYKVAYLILHFPD